jgi:polyphenol oxidase
MNGLSERGAIRFYESPMLAGLDFITHAFCSRHNGVSEGPYASLNFSDREGDSNDKVSRNFEITAAAFEFSSRQFITVNQVHRNEILTIESSGFVFHTCKPMEYDGIITNRPGIAICIKTADCVPIFLVDNVRKVAGVVHAGWKGTVLNIAAVAVNTFKERFSSKTENILAAIGPAIGPCCYEVDRQVTEAISGEKNKVLCTIPCEENEKWMLDLPLLNKLHLQQAGIKEKNIELSHLCTACHTDIFYSHRKEKGKTGRALNFLMLRNGV